MKAEKRGRNRRTRAIDISRIDRLALRALLGRLKGYSFVIYGSMCLLCLLFVWKYLRETKGKSLEQIEREFTGRHLAEPGGKQPSAVLLSQERS